MSEFRVPPHSEEAEIGVLGSVLLEPDALWRVSLEPEAFHDRRHQRLFAELQEMHATGKPMDAITIGEWLAGKGLVDAVGGYDYLSRLQDDALVSAHIEHYAAIVSEKKRMRTMIEVGASLMDGAYQGEDRSLDAITDLMGLESKDAPESILDMGKRFLEDCKKGQVGHFPWWCDEWTDKLGRLSDELVILHGPRSTGKTAITLQWLAHAHRNLQAAPLVSIESQTYRLLPRIIANQGELNTFVMKTRGHVTYSEEDTYNYTLKKVDALNLIIRDGEATIVDVLDYALKQYRRKKFGALFIDNLLCIGADPRLRIESQPLLYKHFFERFRWLRKKLNIPIVVLAHPNAEGNVAWSKDAENLTDIIVYLQEVPVDGMVLKPSNKKIEHKEMAGKHVLAKFSKNRDGPCPVASLEFDGSIQKFRQEAWEA